MNTLAWILLGWFGVVFWSGVAIRLGPGYVLPDAAIIVVAFLAPRRQPVYVGFIALVLGYLMGRQSLAAPGVYETSLVVTGFALYIASGQLAGQGRLYFAMSSAGGVGLFHLLLYLLLYSVRDSAAFASWATALLVPSGMATAVVAFVSYGVLEWLDAKTSPEHREGLNWR